MDKLTLYKRTSTGAVQIWTIWTEGADIVTEYGQLDGKKIIARDTIKKGKGIGTVAETTPEQQAEKEAKSKYDKKLKKDYRKTVDEIGEVGDTKYAGEGGYLPMLAKEYAKRKKFWKFPCMGQPKLDGLRCTAVKEGGKVTLWFRSGKQVTTMKHIEDELNGIMDDGEIWDGELYSHDIDFEVIGGSIRSDKNIKEADALKIQYHIYDAPRVYIHYGELSDEVEFFIEKDSFRERMRIINYKFLHNHKNLSHLKIVSTQDINSEEEMKEKHDEYIRDGYEGIILRVPDMSYEQKRSSNLVKYKESDEDEFKIVGYLEGRGILMGCVGKFVCEFENKVDPEENTFEAKLKGKGVTELLRHYFQHPEEFMGKELTVKYQGFTNKGRPRFPVGKIVRFDK